jgi:hypothetical protein
VSVGRAVWFGLCGWLFGFVYDTCYDMAVCTSAHRWDGEM